MLLRPFIAGYVACILTIAAIGALATLWAQDYVTLPLASYHLDRRVKHNEINTGIGYEHREGEWIGGMGIYKNSFYRDTVYVFGAYTPWYVAGWNVGVLGGLATGYEEGRLTILPAGLVTREWGRFGVNVLLNPVAIGLQLKWRLNE